MTDFIGMDTDAVRNLSDGLTRQAEALQTVTGAIDGLVHRMAQEWHGPDASEFVGWWSQQHKPALLHAHDVLAGLGTSARNNVTQQDQASSGMTAGVGPTPGPAAVVAGSATVAGGVGAGVAAGAGGGVVAAGRGTTATVGAQTAAGEAQPGGAAFLTNVVDTAKSQLGKPSEAAYLSAAPGATSGEWCAAFATWALKQNGVVPNVPDPASVPSWLAAAQSGHNGLSITTDPQPGDLVVYRQEQANGTYVPAHMGIVTSPVSAGTFSAISGNFGSPAEVAESVGAGLHGSIYGKVAGGTDSWGITLGTPVFIRVAPT